MRYHTHRLLSVTALPIVLAVALGAATLAAQYTMTVNADRLVSAQSEPQNWLMMNGDYGSTRYSKLSRSIGTTSRTCAWCGRWPSAACRDVGQNGPEEEVNPLIDNGRMYSTDGWGTIYKIDARDPNQGKFLWVTDPGVKHQGNVPRTRGIALWEDLVIANLPDGRVIAINRDSGEIVWDQKVAGTNEFGSREKFYTAPITAEGKIIVANGAGDGKNARVGRGARCQNRQGTLALVRRAEAG